jgi:hypothetical protein
LFPAATVAETVSTALASDLKTKLLALPRNYSRGVGFDELDCEGHGSQPQAIHRIDDDPAAAEAVVRDRTF